MLPPLKKDKTPKNPVIFVKKQEKANRCGQALHLML
jgi:hypothetical protein